MNRSEGVLGFLRRKQVGAVEPKPEDDINFNLKRGGVLGDDALDNVRGGNRVPEEDLMSDEELDAMVNGNQAPEEEAKKAA